ncbi:MAG: hypothetical protein HYT94_04910 [Parcubacteria group bacterium]|nr:hypothetical protein [Parcubacteria group bacterium]
MTTTEIVKEEDGIADFKIGVDSLLAKRTYFQKRVLPLMVENRDYYTIKGKKSLSKAGAEKLASIYNLVATFERDKETIDCFGGVEGLVAYVCTLTRNGEVVGQGRGAATLKSNGGDANKTMKMAEKSSYISSVIRSTGLSDIFTSDLEDMDPNLISPAPKPPTPKPTSEAAPILSRDYFGLTDEDDFGNSYGSEVDVERENLEREDEEARQRHGEKEWRPATEKQRAFLTSLILDRCADANERERFLSEMESADIGEASELISSFLMTPRY